MIVVSIEEIIFFILFSQLVFNRTISLKEDPGKL